MCVVANDDHGSRQGNTVCLLAKWQRPVAPCEALVVLYQAMHATLHQRIRMVIKVARENLVLFSLLTRDNNSTVTMRKLIYSFEQNQAVAPLATPLGGSPAY